MRKQSTGKSWVGLFTLGLVASFLLLGQVSRAQAGAYVTSDLFSYSMTVTQYANPDDATAGTNPVQQISYPANYTSPQWNLNLVLNPNSVLIRTLFNNADPVGTVFVNPNAPTSFQAYWTSPALNTFQVDLSGGSSSSSDILGIPNPPVDNGSPSNLGTMTSYSFDATFSGLAGAQQQTTVVVTRPLGNRPPLRAPSKVSSPLTVTSTTFPRLLMWSSWTWLFRHPRKPRDHIPISSVVALVLSPSQPAGLSWEWVCLPWPWAAWAVSVARSDRFSPS